MSKPLKGFITYSHTNSVEKDKIEMPTVIQTKKSAKLRQVFSLKFYRCQIA